jgi:hypothetical protein
VLIFSRRDERDDRSEVGVRAGGCHLRVRSSTNWADGQMDRWTVVFSVLCTCVVDVDELRSCTEERNEYKIRQGTRLDVGLIQMTCRCRS